jgi:glycine cleavage system H lipoate-binding protein
LVEHDVDGVKVPGWLWYSLNHFWLELSSEGTIHIGIDGLLACAIGTADRLTFVTHSGLQFPTAVISVSGVDLQLSFPRKLVITKTNSYLRSNPSRIFEHPYTLGWLFEGVASKTSDTDDILKGLLTGSVAVKWMKHEAEQLTKRAHDIAARPVGSGMPLMADGGVSTSGLIRELNREDILSVFNEFFSSNAQRR